MSFPRIAFVAVAVFALSIAGCKVNTINSFPSKPASVRFINLLPDTPSVDVQRENATVWTGVGFGLPTDYQQFDNRQTTFSILAPGNTSPIGTATGSLSAHETYTIVAFGKAGDVSTIFQTDSYANVNAGNSQYRVMHGASGAGGLNFYLSQPGVALGDISPQYQLGIGGNTSFTLVESGDHQIRIARSNSTILAYDSGTISLADKATQTLYMIVHDGTHALDILNVGVSGSQAVLVPNTLAAVKVVNAAYQSGAVDQKWDGNAGAAKVAYPAATQTYYTLPVGTHTITFEANATPGAAIATASETFASATDSTLLISGPNGSQTITMLADRNLSPPSGTARVRVVNASADVPAFDVEVDGKIKASNVAYTHASDYFDIDNSNHKVQFLVPGTTTPIFTIDSQQFGTGQVTSLYLVGPASALAKLLTQDDI